MRVAILLLPTMLAACFVLALSTQVPTSETSATISSRAAEIRELHQLLAKTSARLSVLEPLPHNFLPRGMSATGDPPRLIDGRGTKQRS